MTYESTHWQLTTSFQRWALGCGLPAGFPSHNPIFGAEKILHARTTRLNRIGVDCEGVEFAVVVRIRCLVAEHVSGFGAACQGSANESRVVLIRGGVARGLGKLFQG